MVMNCLPYLGIYITKMIACLIISQVMYDKYSGRSRRFGFVTMSTAEEVAAAIESLNDTVSFIPSFVRSCLCMQWMHE